MEELAKEEEDNRTVMEKLDKLWTKSKGLYFHLLDKIDYFFEVKLGAVRIPNQVRYMLVFFFLTSPLWVAIFLIHLENEDQRIAIA